MTTRLFLDKRRAQNLPSKIFIVIIEVAWADMPREMAHAASNAILASLDPQNDEQGPLGCEMDEEIGCTATPEMAETRCRTTDPSEDQKETLLDNAKVKLSGLSTSLRGIEWSKIPQLAKEYAINNKPTGDQARQGLAEAKLEVIRQIKIVQDLDWENLPMDIKNSITERTPTKDDARRAFERKKLELVDFVQKVEWKNLPQDTKDYIMQNPGKSALFVARYSIPILFPALLAAPLAALLGFSGIGPVAGKSPDLLSISPEI